MGTKDSIYYFYALGSSLREIYDFDKLEGTFTSTATYTTQAGGGGTDCTQPPPCSGITFPMLPGTACTPYIPRDTFNNIIQATGHYGNDPRQLYYVSYPTAGKQVNSPIVVLIHGGGWCIGPNPDNITGWTLGFTTNKSDNFVKNLLDDGFVVVTLLYRLSIYGNTEAEITSNPIKIADIMSDVNTAILHIKNNFPSCLGINANSIQVLGESAGGHIALMWAYAYANPSYIKSVVSMYAPTNLRTFGEYMRNIPSSSNFTCGTNFIGFPWYYPIPDLTNPYEVYNTSNFTCLASGLPNSRVLQTYKMVESLAGTYASTPTTDISLYNASPCNTTNTNIVPTFIMHGNSDVLVPYTQSTTDMSAKLISAGGLKFSWGNSGGIVPTTYPLTPKHGIKIYSNANHGWKSANLLLAPQAALYSLVRSDARNWLNGHKNL